MQIFARDLVGFMIEHDIAGTSDILVDVVLPDPSNIEITHAVQDKKGERMCV